MAEPRPFWSDDFDMDLPKILPDVCDAIRAVEGHSILVYCYCTALTRGRINCPTAWNSHTGPVTHFWTDKPNHPRNEYGWATFGPGNCTTNDQLATATWLEVVRDEWVHQSDVVVDGKLIWRPSELDREFNRLMYDLRDWQKLSAVERQRDLDRCRVSILEANDRFMEVAADAFERIVAEVRSAN